MSQFQSKSSRETTSGTGPLDASVSVVIAAYNQQEFLNDTIKSISEQTTLPREVVVIDDGSPEALSVPETPEVPVTLIRTENRGLPTAWNKGISIAKGDWVAFCDHDDLWLPERLRRQVEAISPDVDFIYCQRSEFIDTTNERRERQPYASDYVQNPLLNLIKSFVATPSTVLARKELFTQAGAFDANLESSADYEMWLRFALNEAKFEIIDEALVLKRVSESSIQGQQSMREKFANVFEVLKRHQVEIATALGKGQNEWELRLGMTLGYFLGIADAANDGATIDFVHDVIKKESESTRAVALRRAEKPELLAGPWYSEEEFRNLLEALESSPQRATKQNWRKDAYPPPP